MLVPGSECERALGCYPRGKKDQSFRANGGCGRESTSGLEWQLRDPHCHLPATLGGSLPFSKIKALPSSSGDNVGLETLKGRNFRCGACMS